MVIPAPLEVDALMKQVPRGRVVTINELRAALATRHRVAFACPITTGIFSWIAAHAAAEAAAEGTKRVTPYWRTLKTGGEINPKYPGGVSVLARRLRAEGHKVIGLDVAPGADTDAVGSVGDKSLVDRLFAERRIEAVIHAGALHKPDIVRYPEQAFVDVNHFLGIVRRMREELFGCFDRFRLDQRVTQIADVTLIFDLFGRVLDLSRFCVWIHLAFVSEARRFRWSIFDNWLLNQFLFYGVLGSLWILLSFLFLRVSLWPLLAAYMVTNGDALYYDRYFLLLMAIAAVSDVGSRRTDDFNRNGRV